MRSTPRCRPSREAGRAPRTSFQIEKSKPLSTVAAARGLSSLQRPIRRRKGRAVILVEIFTRYAGGDGLRSIAKTLNARSVPPPSAGARGTGSWSTSALWAILRRTRYAGVLEWNRFEKMYRKGTKVRVKREAHEWIRIETPYLRIVSDELFAAAQAQMRKKNEVSTPAKAKKLNGGRPPSYLLSGVARCAICGGPSPSSVAASEKSS